MAHNRIEPVPPRFKPGDKVRVKYGVSDPDFPDMPLGGWSGTVTEIIEHEDQINCVFELDKRTLASIHPIYKRRCEIDGLDYKFMGLGQEDIEPDGGKPVPIRAAHGHRAPFPGAGRRGRSGPDGEAIEFPLDDIELGKKDPNRRLLDDYSYWFHNWR